VTVDRLPPDRQLAKRLARDARAAQKAQLRVEVAHTKAVRRRGKAVERARASLPVQVVLAVGAGVAVIPLEPGLSFVALTASAVAGLGAYRSARVLRLPPLPPLPASAVTTGLPPPPHPRSAAFPAVRRLEAVREELRRLLPLVSPAGREVALQAWQAAGEADAALRWQAARLAAVEPHRGADQVLMRQLDDGVACQEQLMRAVADLVAASADPLATGRLQDATDALTGLAQALRELR